MSDDERLMARAIALARTSAFTSPNPKVGAVVVRGGRVLSEAVHRGPGTPHAEARALQTVDAHGATLYVTLEPCAHEGQTPPCAPAIVGAGVTRVVAAIEDPDPRVRGTGFQYLRAQGVEVTTGVLADEARRVNAAYIHQRTRGLPLVVLKLALSLDGRLAAGDRSARWITGEAARSTVHARRAECDAVMVGAGTVIEDDPRLTARLPSSDRQPARVVVDATGRVPATAAVFDIDAAPAEVIVATTDEAPHEVQLAWKAAGAEVLVLPRSERGVDLRALFERLADKRWLEVMCEGGARLATSLLADDLVDRLELHYGTVVLGAGGPAIGDVGVGSLTDAPRWRLAEWHTRDDDVLLTLEPRNR